MLGGERGVRLLFQANAVRVGPTQFPRLWQMHVEMCATFDWEHVPELYVTQTPEFNAGAYGIDDPFIVIHSAALELLEDDEIRALLAHELGHVMSGHSLYQTIAMILSLVSLSALPMFAGLALLPIKLAFLEWSRKAELTADRCGMLGSQDALVMQRKFMKMAGGGRGDWFTAADLNAEAFMAQAHEYANSNEGFDILYKVINTLGLTHPMATVRAGEIQKWLASGDYDRILRGEYVKRGTPEADRPLRDHAREAKDYYAEEIRDMGQKVGAAAKQAADNIREAFRNAKSGA
ncbi:MAG: M48 family metallopeptidase [Gemmatimonadetes bacterium]|nr:M48 family metallopeptidase [Gemmatimonadota bacterium]